MWKNICLNFHFFVSLFSSHHHHLLRFLFVCLCVVVVVVGGGGGVLGGWGLGGGRWGVRREASLIFLLTCSAKFLLLAVSRLTIRTSSCSIRSNQHFASMARWA